MIRSNKFIADIKKIDAEAYASLMLNEEALQALDYKAVEGFFKTQWKPRLENYLQSIKPSAKELERLLESVVKTYGAPYFSPLYRSYFKNTQFSDTDQNAANFSYSSWSKKDYDTLLNELNSSKTHEEIEETILQYQSRENVADGSFYHINTRFRPRHPVYYMLLNIQNSQKTLHLDVDKLIPRLNDHIVGIKNKNIQSYMLALSIASGLKAEIIAPRKETQETPAYRGIRDINKTGTYTITYKIDGDKNKKEHTAFLLCRSADFFDAMQFVRSIEYNDNPLKHPRSETIEDLGLDSGEFSYRALEATHAAICEYFFANTKSYIEYREHYKVPKTKYSFEIIGNSNLTKILQDDFDRRTMNLEREKSLLSPKDLSKLERVFEMMKSNPGWTPTVANIKGEFGGTSESAMKITNAIASLDSQPIKKKKKKTPTTPPTRAKSTKTSKALEV